MSNSDIATAKKFASIAVNAAAQCAAYTNEARRAPEYTDTAKTYAEAAAESSQSASQFVSVVQNSSQQSAQSASAAAIYAQQAKVAQEAAEAAEANAHDAAKNETDAVRADLASSSEGKGAALIGVRQSFLGAIDRNQEEINSQLPSVEDAGAKGDGISNDSMAFSTFEAEIADRDVDLHGKTYLVDSIPTGNRYFNGSFIKDGSTYNANAVFSRDISGVILVGEGSGESFPADYVMAGNLFSYSNATIAMGKGALSKAAKAAQTIAIGPSAMGNTLLSFTNIAIGEVALQNVQSSTDAYSIASGADMGTRNIAIGGNAGQFLIDGVRNNFIGRNAGTGSVNTNETTAVGSGALFGYNVNGWHKHVENYIPNKNTSTTISVYGCDSANLYAGISTSSFGHSSASNLKIGDANCFFGVGAARDLEKNVGWNGYVRTDYGNGETVNYTKTGSDIVVTRTAHSAVVGGTAYILWKNDGPAFPNHNHPFRLDVTSTTADTFSVQCPYTADGSGTATLYWTTSLTLDTASRHNVFFGHNAGLNNTSAQNSIVIGSLAAQLVSSTLTNCVINGMSAMQNVTQQAIGTVAIGYQALQNNTGTANNTVALGYRAGYLMQDGSIPSISVNNSSCIGANSRVSGSSQVQLGDSGTTPYAYNALQLRSDSRDKYQIRDTELGSDFILGLRAVQGVWNLRDYYYVTTEVQKGTVNDEDTGEEIPLYETVTTFDQEGYEAATKAGTRFHNWFIAQEVAELAKKLGVDFAGLQDHSVNGGCDVLSLGYEEFIPPIVKTIQQCWSRIDDLEKRISTLESK